MKEKEISLTDVYIVNFFVIFGVFSMFYFLLDFGLTQAGY